MSFAVRFGSVLQYILMLTSVEYTTFISRFCNQLEQNFTGLFSNICKFYQQGSFSQRHQWTEFTKLVHFDTYSVTIWFASSHLKLLTVQTLKFLRVAASTRMHKML